jgi:hypothetical protein
LALETYLLDLDLEIVWRQASRPPHIAKGTGTSEGGVRPAANEDREPAALRRQRPKVALVIPIKLPIEGPFRA